MGVEGGQDRERKMEMYLKYIVYMYMYKNITMKLISYN